MSATKALAELEDALGTYWGEGVKALKQFMLDELKLKETKVSVRGDFGFHGDDAEYLVVRIACIEFTDNSLRGGFDFSAHESANNLGLLSAAGRFVETFHTEPHTPPGWTSAIDDHGKAKAQLQHLLRQNDPDAMLRFIARINELATKFPSAGMAYVLGNNAMYEGASCPLKEVMATLLAKSKKE